jgi:sec-independent protein translocase protein TatA/sec-independent protein translocase protein TatB
MFGFGFSEVIVILIVVLIVVGPKKLPEVAKMLGRTYAQFKRAFEDIKDSVDLDLDDNKHKYRKSKNSLNNIYHEKWENDIAKTENAEANNGNIIEAESAEINNNKKNENKDLLDEEKEEKDKNN